MFTGSVCCKEGVKILESGCRFSLDDIPDFSKLFPLSARNVSVFRKPGLLAE
ncbi:hypothetical protein [Pantoea agglomerans]|uniref:hypothetical protein n=1 Tax=Enterobacter agglomerans TaxID=549 RepID=UPI0035259A6F